jgi:hypothetical protein
MIGLQNSPRAHGEGGGEVAPEPIGGGGHTYDPPPTVARSWQSFSANPTIKFCNLAKISAIFLDFVVM